MLVMIFRCIVGWIEIEGFNKGLCNDVYLCVMFNFKLLYNGIKISWFKNNNFIYFLYVYF